MSKNSSNQEMFNIAKVEYQDALKKSGYDEPKTQNSNKIWFNPPFHKPASTNIGSTFLQLVTFSMKPQTSQNFQL